MKSTYRPILISQTWLKKHRACKEGLEWFQATYGERQVRWHLVMHRLQETKHDDWAQWLYFVISHILALRIQNARADMQLLIRFATFYPSYKRLLWNHSLPT